MTVPVADRCLRQQVSFASLEPYGTVGALKQEQSIALLKTRWSTVGDPTPLPCDDCVMVRVSSDSTGVSMVLGIEADGHIHS